MLIVAKRRYKKQYVIGGAGIFDTVAGFFKKLFVSNAAKQIASTALNAGKDAAKEIGKKALDVGKTVAINDGARLDNNNNNNINNVMMGHGVNPPVTTKNAIRIQNLVRRLNGGGLKVV